jgi:ribonuclease P protein component
MNNFTFGKNEKLCSQKIIGEMFESGLSFLCFPLKVTWLKVDELPSEFPVQVAFSVPKRIFKHAHDRNRLKRLMRESYRLHKDKLYQIIENKETKVALMLVYIGKEKLEYAKIFNAITKVINRLEKEI